MPYQKTDHSRTWYITVVGPGKKYERLSTGVHDLETALDMELMLRTLARRGSRDWDLVNALLDRDPAASRRRQRRRLRVPDLYDAWRADQKAEQPKALDALWAKLADVDLAPMIDAWQAAIAKKVRPDTADQYRRNVAALLAENGTLLRSTITTERLCELRDTRPGGVPNRLAHLTAWSSFFNHLRERGFLATNPLRGDQVKWPREPKRGARVRHIRRLEDVRRFVAAMPTLEDRAIAALREGVGADWDALEPMTREDVLNHRDRRVQLPGDKTPNRLRDVQLERWAWAHVSAYLRATAKRPKTERLFTVNYETYKSRHNAVRARLRGEDVPIPAGYSPHNSRHSFAVRKRRAGWPDWKIAAYLGNTAAEVARTYGRFTPDREDLAHDEGTRRKAKRRKVKRRR